MSEMSIGETIKTFFKGFVKPSGGAIGGLRELAENKEAKELAEAKTNENEQVETELEDGCCWLHDGLNKAKENAKGSLDKSAMKKAEIGAAILTEKPVMHEIIKQGEEIVEQGGLLKMGINAVKGWFKK